MTASDATAGTSGGSWTYVFGDARKSSSLSTLETPTTVFHVFFFGTSPVVWSKASVSFART
jgi:hypothetical protein